MGLCKPSFAFRLRTRSVALNYRHAFHAGNFADLAKHAILLALLSELTKDGPLAVLDTHAGAGGYDLHADQAQRSGEAQAGIARLMAAADTPDALQVLVAAVEAYNDGGALRRYPGSPALIANTLRPGDRFLGCELRPDDYALLDREVRKLASARKIVAAAAKRDGYGEVAGFVQGAQNALVLIDPPFERGDEYAQVLTAIKTIQAAGACAAIWTPLKDLETFDAFLRGLEQSNLDDVVVAEVRLRPLVDPMKMNGCALVLVNAPDVGAQATGICDWIAAKLGESGGRGQVFRL